MVTALGLVSRKGSPLTAQTFGALLRNPIYAGVLRSKGLRLSGSRADFEPLVSESLFERARPAQADGAFQRHHLDHPDFPLRRFVLCDLCSTPLTEARRRDGRRRIRTTAAASARAFGSDGTVSSSSS
jgi:hypothetical protein